MFVGEKVASENLFRIASLAKPVTAVAILQCAEQGKLKRDDPVFGKDKWIPTGDLPDETSESSNGYHLPPSSPVTPAGAGE